MDISFNCVSCGQHIIIDAAGAGMSVRCPKCSQPLIVPETSTTGMSRIAVASPAIDPAHIYTCFRGRGPAKPTQIIGAQYFYRSQEKEEKGPFSKLEMRGFMRKKIVEPETLVLCPATQQWIPCERFPELPKPAYNKLLHFEKDTRFSVLIQEIPHKIVEHIGDKISEVPFAFCDSLSKEPLNEDMGDKISEVKFASWLVGRIKECGYRSPDWDEGTINDLLYEDRIKMILRTNRQSWIGYLQYRQGGGLPITNKPVLIGF
jgi:DNA-directed RNA polymerase subunit RPC12/RpoP